MQGRWRRTPAAFRAELVGQATLGLVALLGVGLYATTYSLVYAGGGPRPVAVLEMWMVWSQASCAALGLAAQAAAAGVLTAGLPHVAEAQSAALLGVALAVTCVGGACLSGVGTACAAYYPAALLPPLAAVGSVAWAWVVYLAAAASGGGLGVGGRAGLTAAASAACLQPLVAGALQATCGNATAWVAGGQLGPAPSADASALLTFGALALAGLGGLARAAGRGGRAAEGGALALGGLLVAADAGAVLGGAASAALRVCCGVAGGLALCAGAARALGGAAQVRGAPPPSAGAGRRRAHEN